MRHGCFQWFYFYFSSNLATIQNVARRIMNQQLQTKKKIMKYRQPNGRTNERTNRLTERQTDRRWLFMEYKPKKNIDCSLFLTKANMNRRPDRPTDRQTTASAVAFLVDRYPTIFALYPVSDMLSQWYKKTYSSGFFCSNRKNRARNDGSQTVVA